MRVYFLFFVLVACFSCQQDKNLKTLKGGLYKTPIPMLFSETNANPYILLDRKGELLKLKQDEINDKAYELKGEVKYQDRYQLFVVHEKKATQDSHKRKLKRTNDYGLFSNKGKIVSFKCAGLENCNDKKTIENDNFAFVTFKAAKGISKSLIIAGKRNSSIAKLSASDEIIPVSGSLLSIHGLKFLFVEGEKQIIEKGNLPKSKKAKKRTQ